MVVEPPMTPEREKSGFAARVGRGGRPLIAIRGLLGSTLVDRADDTRVWGDVLREVANPRHPEAIAAAAHPMGLGVPLGSLRDGVAAERAIRGFRTGYRALDALKGSRRAHGVSRDRGRRTVLAYDWRREISEHARVLHEHILSRLEGTDGDGRVDVVAHSMGGLMLQYYLRYGPEPLPDDGSLPEVTWAGARFVHHAVVMGTPVAGSVSGVTTLARGATVLPLVGPKYPASLLGTIASVYQLLPRAELGRVIEAASGASVDLFDVEVWRRYRWGLFHGDRTRLFEALTPDRSTPERERIAEDHLAKCLARATQFYLAVRQGGAPPEGTRLHAIAGSGVATADVLEVSAGGKLRVIERSPGDGIVTRSSALARLVEDSPGVGSSVVVDTSHRRMPSDPTLARQIGRMMRG